MTRTTFVIPEIGNRPYNTKRWDTVCGFIAEREPNAVYGFTKTNVDAFGEAHTHSMDVEAAIWMVAHLQAVFSGEIFLHDPCDQYDRLHTRAHLLSDYASVHTGWASASAAIPQRLETDGRYSAVAARTAAYFDRNTVMGDTGYLSEVIHHQPEGTERYSYELGSFKTGHPTGLLELHEYEDGSVAHRFNLVTNDDVQPVGGVL
ncbi:hypothetical protein [Corynebacterium propinquum]